MDIDHISDTKGQPAGFLPGGTDLGAETVDADKATAIRSLSATVNLGREVLAKVSRTRVKLRDCFQRYDSAKFRYTKLLDFFHDRTAR